MKNIILTLCLSSLVISQCDETNWEGLFPFLDGCQLDSLDLNGTDFSNASLNDANFTYTNLSSCNFTEASLINANLTDAITWNTIFEGAYMCGVDMSDMDYIGSPITEADCFNVCGGEAVLDECGVCDGDGTACFGCTDPFALNYSEYAIYDDGSCEYFDGEISGDAPSEIWIEHLWDEDAPFENDVIVPNYSAANWSYEDNFKCVESFNGGVTCAGNYYSYFESSGCNTNNYNIFIYELDINGNMIWFKEYGNWDEDGNLQCNTYEYQRGIIKDNEGYYLYGNISSSTPTRGYVLKLDPNGNQVWLKFKNFYEDDIYNTDYIRSGISSSNGNLIFVGSGSYPSISYDATIWIMDSDGNDVANFNYHLEQPEGNNSESESFFDVIETFDGNYAAVGRGYVDGGGLGNAYYPFIIRFNENEIISANYIYEVFSSDFKEWPSLAEINDGNLMIVGTNNSTHATLIVTNSQGEYISHTSDHFGFEISEGDSYAFDVINTIDNKIIVLGTANTGFEYFDLFSFKMDQAMNIEWVYYFGNYFGSEDWGHGITQLSDNSLVLSGWGYTIYQSSPAPFVIRTHFQDGCMDPLGCNYNPYASNDNGSCYYEDICDVCDGNGFDFCDDDGDGINNYEQWGYGPYNISVSDVPEDQGGRVYIDFYRSFYDSDSLVGRSEMYTIERLDSEDWVVVQSFGAFGSDTYTVEVNTLNNNDSTYFRIIANMDEGNYLSYETGVGVSEDNIAPAVPTILMGSFDDGVISLEWSPPEDEDFQYFNIYRTDTLYSQTTENTFLDTDVPSIPSLTYSITALDYSENESNPSENYEVEAHLMGDLSNDYLLNVIDVVMMIEYILEINLDIDTTYADMNGDGNIDVSDIVILVEEILAQNEVDGNTGGENE